MMNKLFFNFCLYLSVLVVGVFAGCAPANDPKVTVSPARDPNIDFSHYMLSSQQEWEQWNDVIFETPQNTAKPWQSVDFQKITTWSRDQLIKYYQLGRDHRFLKDPQIAKNLRRIPWLYPDDGCYARTSALIRNLTSWKQNSPNTIYIFGNLRLATKYSPHGFVSWWYHVAPIVRVGKELFVLDPSVHPHFEIPLKTWVERLTDDPQNVTYAICSGSTISPTDNCKQGSAAKKNWGKDFIETQLLHRERQRLIELGRDPNKELGDQPPWVF